MPLASPRYPTDMRGPARMLRRLRHADGVVARRLTRIDHDEEGGDEANASWPALYPKPRR